jgi:hypothetical protein
MLPRHSANPLRFSRQPRADLSEGPLTSMNQTFALQTGTTPSESSFSVKRPPKSQFLQNKGQTFEGTPQKNWRILSQTFSFLNKCHISARRRYSFDSTVVCQLAIRARLKPPG